MDAVPRHRGLTPRRHLPYLDARDLTGIERVLPRDPPADPCVVLLAFRQRQQADVDDWVSALPGLPVIEVPLLAPAWRMVRGWIESGMAGTTQNDARARVWCAYSPVKQVLASQGEEGHRRMVTAVVARSGEVITLARGGPTPGTAAAIQTAMGRQR